MKIRGYLSRKKSNGKLYIYVRRSFREEGKVKHEYIYSFGSMPNALEEMYDIRDKPDTFPAKLKERGYDLVDLDDWILTMQTGVTSTGRDFKL